MTTVSLVTSELAESISKMAKVQQQMLALFHQNVQQQMSVSRDQPIIKCTLDSKEFWAFERHGRQKMD